MAFTYKTVQLRNSKSVTGNRIILPESVIRQIHYSENEANVWIFRLSYRNQESHDMMMTHCGVMEFTAEENKVIIPSYIMEFMKMEEFQTITVRRTRLPKGRFARFKPLDSDFFLIPNRKSFLERVLRDYVALTERDIVQIAYRDRTYSLMVTKLEPGNAVQIVNCDLEVDFEEADEKLVKDYYSRNSRTLSDAEKENAVWGRGKSLLSPKLKMKVSKLRKGDKKTSKKIGTGKESSSGWLSFLLDEVKSSWGHLSSPSKSPSKSSSSLKKSSPKSSTTVKNDGLSKSFKSQTLIPTAKKKLPPQPDFDWRRGELHFRREAVEEEVTSNSK